MNQEEKEVETYEGEMSKCCDAPMQEGNNQCMSCGACGLCEGSGFVQKTEWSGTDDSYDVDFPCVCNPQ